LKQQTSNLSGWRTAASPTPPRATLDQTRSATKYCDRNALFETSDADVIDELHAAPNLTAAFHENAPFGIRKIRVR
jgi:hypothetical protein